MTNPIPKANNINVKVWYNPKGELLGVKSPNDDPKAILSNPNYVIL